MPVAGETSGEPCTGGGICALVVSRREAWGDAIRIASSRRGQTSRGRVGDVGRRVLDWSLTRRGLASGEASRGRCDPAGN